MRTASNSIDAPLERPDPSGAATLNGALRQSLGERGRIRLILLLEFGEQFCRVLFAPGVELPKTHPRRKQQTAKNEPAHKVFPEVPGSGVD